MDFFDNIQVLYKTIFPRKMFGLLKLGNTIILNS